MRVICISGKAGHGKDYFASLVQKELEDAGYSVMVTHYGDLTKYICSHYFDWNGEKDEYGRRLLQHIGTDVVRAYDENFWVNHIFHILQMFTNQWDFVMLPDTRFPNEIDVLKERGLNVTSVRVNRPNFFSNLTAEQLLHSSETSLDSYSFDHVIYNDGTDVTMQEAALNFTRELFGHQISFDEYLT